MAVANIWSHSLKPIIWWSDRLGNKTHCRHTVSRAHSIMESITTTDLAMTVQPTIFPRVGYSILSYLMFINTLLSVFNNLLVISVMLKNMHFLNAMNVIIFSMAVSDLMIATCGSAIVTITNYEGSFFLGHAFCVFQGFAVNYFGEYWLKGDFICFMLYNVSPNMLMPFWVSEDFYFFSM